MKYKLCLFDFDYTLADATMPILECFRYTYSKMNLGEFDKEKAIKTIGMTLNDAFICLTNIEDMNTIEECVKNYRIKSEEITVKNTVLFDDTIKTLEALKDKNIKVGIVSTRMGARIIKILEHLDCIKYVDHVVGFEHVSSHKPSPEGLHKALEYFKCNKDEVLYIGDSYIDAKAAENGAIDFIGVTTGTTSQNDFEEYNNIRIVNSVSQILEVI
ncbi:MAG: HAD-IA family hydrolase [Terrisporobacter sp.]|uniref:HAD family hydrolase n=1 Tax=Terrisporobacter sp. TaxID=1965305 RepID=UPI002FCA4F11